jgi:guanylate kinase
MTGPLIILSGPAGAGKSTVISRLLKGNPDLPLRLSVSATTRRPRPGERDGVDYHFWTKERFDQERAANAFVEWAEVYGNYYGTLKSEVEPFRQKGLGVILEIDTQGAAAVKRLYPEVVRVLLRAPSDADFGKRLIDRGTEDPEALERRIKGVQRELAGAVDYEHTIINENLDKAVAEFRTIIERQFAKGT